MKGSVLLALVFALVLALVGPGFKNYPQGLSMRLHWLHWLRWWDFLPRWGGEFQFLMLKAALYFVERRIF